MSGSDGVIRSSQVEEQDQVKPGEALDCIWIIRAPPQSKVSTSLAPPSPLTGPSHRTSDGRVFSVQLTLISFHLLWAHLFLFSLYFYPCQRHRTQSMVYPHLHTIQMGTIVFRMSATYLVYSHRLVPVCTEQYQTSLVPVSTDQYKISLVL